MSELESLLKQNKLKALADSIYKDQETKYPFGPLNKSEETKIFEALVHELLQESSTPDKKIKFLKSQNHEIILKKGDVQINLKKLMEKVNLTHISVSTKDIMQYEKIKSFHTHKVVLPGKEVVLQNSPTHSEFLNRIEKSKTLQTKKLSELEYGEMLAINQYTGEKYQYINKLLRDPNSLQVEQIPEMIMHIAVASQGLNKVHDTNLPTVIRNQGNEYLNEYIKNVKENNVTQEKAFISTSYESQEQFIDQKVPVSEGVKIIFKNVKGKDISPLSLYPDEKEYLLSPSTQLKWSGYTKTELGHIFVAEGANVLIEEEIKKSNSKTHDSKSLPPYEPPPDYDNPVVKKYKTSYSSYEPFPDYDDKTKKYSNSLKPPPEPKIDYLKSEAEKIGAELKKTQATKINNLKEITSSQKFIKNNNSWSK